MIIKDFNSNFTPYILGVVAYSPHQSAPDAYWCLHDAEEGCNLFNHSIINTKY